MQGQNHIKSKYVFYVQYPPPLENRAVYEIM